MSANRSKEWSRLYCRPDLHGIESLHARFVHHRYARHAHEHLVVGLVEEGVQSYFYRGARRVTLAGEIFLVNPGEGHTGEPAVREGYLYRTLCVSPQLLSQVSAECSHIRDVPFFPEAVIRDRPLAVLLSRFHRGLREGASALESESLLLSSLRNLLVRHAATSPTHVGGRERPGVRTAREYLNSQYSKDVSLSELATLVGLTPFHLARVFQKEIGLPPHSYLEHVRVREACTLLRDGQPIARTALMVGYPDQSHFTRRFKRMIGVTPGQYAKVHDVRVSRLIPETPGSAMRQSCDNPSVRSCAILLWSREEGGAHSIADPLPFAESGLELGRASDEGVVRDLQMPWRAGRPR